jgi:hypothetical protein
LVIRGVVGTIKWSYITAAEINGYTVARSKTGEWSLRATVAAFFDFRMKQRPLHFEAATDRGLWIWPLEDFTYGSNGQLVARLGKPPWEVDNHALRRS